MIDARTISDLRWLSEAEGYLAHVRRELAQGVDEELEWAEREVSALVDSVRAGLAALQAAGTA